MGVHARVPWPMEAERERLRRLEEAHQWDRLQKSYEGLVDGEQVDIERLEAIIQKRRNLIAGLQPVIADIVSGPRSPEKYQQLSLTLGQMLGVNAAG